MSINMNQFNQLPDPLTVKQVADLYHVKPITVYRWAKSGKISYFQATAHGAIRFSKQAVLDFDEKYHHTAINNI